jgi:hypothetical protein
MQFAKTIFFSLICIPLIAFGDQKTENSPICNKETCVNDPNCLCWCSQICNWRKKTAEDRPVYIKNDPHKKYCYCKQWDFDNYENNCIHGKNIPEPPDAK